MGNNETLQKHCSQYARLRPGVFSGKGILRLNMGQIAHVGFIKGEPLDTATGAVLTKEKAFMHFRKPVLCRHEGSS